MPITMQEINRAIVRIISERVTGERLRYNNVIENNQLKPGAINSAIAFASHVRPIQVVDALPLTGQVIGDVVFLTTNNKLYRWTGSAWTSALAAADIAGQITDAQLADGSVGQTKLASGLTAVEIVDVLPASGTEGAVVFLTTDHKLYRWTGSAWTASVPTIDLTGTITSAQIAAGAVGTTQLAAGLSPIEVVNSLPAIGNTGSVVFLTTDSKLYRWTGSAWTAAVPTADLTGTIGAALIAAGAITAGKIAVDAVTAGTIATAAVNTRELVAGAVTAATIAAGAIVAGKIAADAVTAGTIAAAAVNTRELAADAVTAVKIAAGSIIAAKIAAGAIEALHLAANSVTAGAINAGAVTASAIAVSALSAISGNAGVIVSGRLQNFDNTTYLDLDATGAGHVLHHPSFYLAADGSAVFAGTLASETFTASIINALSIFLDGNLGMGVGNYITWTSSGVFGAGEVSRIGYVPFSGGLQIDPGTDNLSKVIPAGVHPIPCIIWGGATAPSNTSNYKDGDLWFQQGPGPNIIYIKHGASWIGIVGA